MASHLPTGPLWDSSIFTKTISVVGIKVPQEKTSKAMKTLQSFLLRKRHTKPVLSLENSKKLLLLDPVTLPSTKSALEVESINAMVKDEGAEVILHDVELTYDSYTLEEALPLVLPADTTEIPTSFEIVGHVAHLNLKKWHLPHKYVIGRMLLDKTSGIRTVVNKTETIQNQYRVFPMEVIAGEDNLDVEVSESGCIFRFNFGDVYWNSRLQAEHDRIVTEIMKRSAPVVADMFAGVGPFSIPLAKRRATVYANDLNPESYEYLQQNAKANKIVPRYHTASNLDGRVFMKDLILHGVRPTDVIMNLPATAIEFLDVFKGLYLEEDTELPTIHCYSFADEDEGAIGTVAHIEAILGTSLVDPKVHSVRNIAPRRWMYCTSFDLPLTIERRTQKEEDARPASPKKAKRDANQTPL